MFFFAVGLFFATIFVALSLRILAESSRKNGTTISFSLALVAAVATLLSSNPSQAVVQPFLSATFSPSPSANDIPGYFNNTTLLTSYTTASGTVGGVNGVDLSHAVLGTGQFGKAPDGVSVYNTWGYKGAEIDGPLAVLNLDISTGLIDAGKNFNADSITISGLGNGSVSDSSNFFFSQTINTGQAGGANDFFLIESGNGSDAIDIFPLDASGNTIGNFSLVIPANQLFVPEKWGVLSNVIQARATDNSGALVFQAFQRVGGVAFDLEDFNGSGTLTGVRGFAITGGGGLDTLVVGVHNNLAPVPKATLTINRDSGEATLSNAGTVALDITGYSLASGLGVFDSSQWLSVTNEYDVTSGGELDSSGEWQVLSSLPSNSELSESAQGATQGTLTPGQSLSLGDVWIPSVFEEVFGVVTLADNSQLPITVVYEEALNFSDLNNDGLNNSTDWILFRDNHLEDILTGHTLIEARGLGDLDGDGDNDEDDFFLFREHYNSVEGQGAFSGMLQTLNVPEPSSLALLGLATLGLSFGGRRHRRHSKLSYTELSCKSKSGRMAIRGGSLVVLLVAFAMMPETVSAVTLDVAADTIVIEGRANAAFGVFGIDETGFRSTTNLNAAETDLHYLAYYRFDLSELAGGEPLAYARLNLTHNRTYASTFDLNYFGLTHAQAGLWTNFSLTYNNAPGVNSDSGSPFSSNIIDEVDAGATDLEAWDLDDPSVPVAQLGKIANAQHTANFTHGFSSAASVNLLETALANGDESVTFIVANEITTNGTLARLYNGLSQFERDPIGDETATPLAATFKPNLEILTVAEVPRIRVNRLNGDITFVNPTASPIDFSRYEIDSPAGALSLTPNTLANQEIDSVDGGNDAGELWEVAESSANTLAELFLLGDTTLAAGGGEQTIFGAYDTSNPDDEGMTFEYLDLDMQETVTGYVEFYTPDATPGDFDSDGDVDGSDFLSWQRGQSPTPLSAGDLSDWQANYGPSGVSLAASAAVPEPTACGLIFVAGLFSLTMRKSPIVASGIR